MLDKIVGGLITIMVGVTLLPEISNLLYSGNDLVGWTIQETPKEILHRQTYLEYVKERLEVEKLMHKGRFML